MTSQNVGFTKGGKLVEVPVKVGDKVQPGQLLAKIDDFPAKQALRQAQGSLDQAQAQLDKIVNGNQADAAGRVENQTKDIYDAVKRQADAINDGNDKAVFHARKKLDADKAALQAAYAVYKQACPMAKAGGSAEDDDSASDAAGDPQSGQPGQSGLLSGLTGGQGSLMDQLPNCDTARANYITAKNTYNSSKASYDAAVAKRDSDKATQKVSVENAQLALVRARNDDELAGTDRDANIDAAEGAVESARAQVANAQRDVENTVLFAPVAGTISAVTGVVGEYVGNGAPQSALAPGSGAVIPGVGAAATSDSAGNAGGGLSATRPGGGAFIVLNDLNTFQVVVPFEESDAAKVSPGQKVDVSFDAVPDLTREGTVLSIAPGGIAISGVTNYYATVLLNESDPRLKAGQTAEAGVRTSSKDNVLVVPNGAVIRQGGRTLVNVPGPDGQPQQVPFQPGVVGDDNTEVLSGLREGQPILLPQAQVAPGGQAPR
ncbi:HlyD family secretion protein [Pseudonocardia eucalypti]|uniref:HlyD family efflux transporter periplasmic adaptor subunit n=1 Tax=Pseudonocardia eucalypti TaxID=648755 RepID=UPI00161E711A|nr:HlyD family secretion protein [Pseudonocardia eucalypti]